MNASNRASLRSDDLPKKMQVRATIGGVRSNDCPAAPASAASTRPATAGRRQVVSDVTTVQGDVLASLARLRLATTSQLQRLHIAGRTPLAAARGVRRNMARLEELRLVTRLERRIGGVGAGSTEAVWALDTSGQQLVASRGPAGGGLRRRPWTPSLPFVRHRLAITELYVQLACGDRQGPGELLSFTAEPDSWRHYTGPGGAAVTLKPDASATTAHGDYEHSWFIEVDLATESPLVIGRKTAAYLAYRRSGSEQARSGVFPLVVFTVPHERRARVIDGVLRRLAPADQRVFRVHLQAEAATALLRGEA